MVDFFWGADMVLPRTGPKEPGTLALVLGRTDLCARETVFLGLLNCLFLISVDVFFLH